MLNKIQILTIVMLSTVSIYAQSDSLKSSFFSLHSGIFLTSLENFDETYDSQYGFVYGLGIGMPLSTRLSIYGKATLFSKSGSPVIKTYNYENGTRTLVSESREGSASFTQWIINGGLLYNYPINENWILGLNGGITYSIVSEKQKNGGGDTILSIEGSGIFGFFFGGILERKFNKSSFSLFFEPQYNSSRSDVLNYVGNYGGLNLNIGARYYFKMKKPKRKNW